MKPPYFLALDIGTSSVRSAVYDAEANVFEETMVKNERTLTSTDDGGFEIEVEEAFSQTVAAIDDVLGKIPTEVENIEYSAASCFWHSILGIDKNGNPTTKVFAWAETRPAKYVQNLRDELNEKAVHNRTGCHFHSSYWTAKLLWLRTDRKEEFEKTDKWISFCDYVVLKLSGELKTSVSMASGTGIFDIRENIWDEKLLEYLKIKKENLPEIIEKDDDTFELNDEYKKRWEKLKDTKFFLAIGDGAGNNIGANCVQKDKAALMIGTSGAMRVGFEGDVPRRIPFGLWCYRIDRKRILIGGALSNGGGLYGWLKTNFRLKKNDDKTENKIEARQADGHGITFLPFLAGERSTGYHENASGSIIGLRQSHDKIDIVQAALEAVAYRFAEIFEQLNKVLEIKQIIASGGALRESPIWTQIICDTLGQNMSLPATREASSTGVILLASEYVGKIENIAELEPPEGRRFEFNCNNHKIYQQARERHEKFYKLLVE
ncbi:MAG: gluconokinase [Acidobacteriota bacterium]|nr:gluconokinase [Acidobacteriota bacterium]